MAIKGVYRINVDQLAATIDECLKELANRADGAIEEAASFSAQKGAQTLKATSPKLASNTYNRTNRKGTKKRKPGKYAKGWRVKAEGGGAGHLYIIHNATDYQLTHLLEKGHALRQGGRSRAIVHIKPVEQDAIKDFEKLLRQFIESGEMSFTL